MSDGYNANGGLIIIGMISKSIFRLLAVSIFMLSVSAAYADAVRLMIFGDSLVAGYGLDRVTAFPRQLESRLKARGFDVEVLNAGVSGDTTSSGRSRLDWTLAEMPDAMMIVLGGNDMLRGVDPSVTRRNLDKILGSLKDKNIPVMLCGMLASPNLGADYQAEFDSIYPELAAKYGIAFYPFFLEGVALVPKFNQPDGIHPNALGVRKIVVSMIDDVGKFLTEIK